MLASENMSLDKRMKILNEDIQDLMKFFSATTPADHFKPLTETYECMVMERKHKKESLDNELKKLQQEEEQYQRLLEANTAGVQQQEKAVEQLQRQVEIAIEKSATLKNQLRYVTGARDEEQARLLELDRKRKAMEAEEERQTSLYKNQMSLYHHLTGIVWHETNSNQIAGNITGLKSDSTKLFTLDKTKMSSTEIADQLWELVEETSKTEK